LRSLKKEKRRLNQEIRRLKEKMKKGKNFFDFPPRPPDLLVTIFLGMKKA